MEMNSEERNEIFDFSVKVIEFFKNDYLVMFDFLKGKSPWDSTFQLGMNIPYEELNRNKQRMREKAVDIYYTYVVRPVYVAPEGERHIMAVDKDFFIELNKKKTPMDIFMTNEFCTLQMLKFYVKFIDDNTTLNICTKNKFKSDLAAIYNIIEDLNKKYGLDKKENESPKELKINIADYYEELYNSVIKYNGCSFRSNDEIKEFINYIYSLAYAYVVKDNIGRKPLDIESEVINYFKELVETTDDLYIHFYTEGLSSIIVFDLIYEVIKKYGAYYDLRKNIDDNRVQELFEKLDNNYLDDEMPDIMMNDFALDLKLDYLLSTLCLKNPDYDKIYELLMDGTPLYKDLIKLGLDPRFTEYYKEQMIRKIIANVFEYESYNNSIDPSIENSKNSTDIKCLDTDRVENLIFYFDENYSELLEKYHEFLGTGDNNMYRAREYIYKTDQLSVIDKIYSYGISKYFMMMIGRIRATDSVDYMNKYLSFAEMQDHPEMSVLL